MPELMILDQPMEDLDEWYEKELHPLIYSSAILTGHVSDEPLKVDIARTKTGFQYAYPPYNRTLVDGLIMHMLRNGGGGLILRSFLAEKVPSTGVPYKEISGWFINPEGKDLFSSIIRIPAEEVKKAHTTDAQTGELLPVQEGVLFR